MPQAGYLKSPEGSLILNQGDCLKKSITEAFSLKLRQEANQVVGRFFFARAVSSHVVGSPYFKEMCKAVVKVPSASFVPPTQYKLGGLKEEDQLTAEVN